MEPWILPIVQGYVEIRTLVVHSDDPPDVLQTTQQTPHQSHHDGGAEEVVGMMTFEDKKTEQNCKYTATLTNGSMMHTVQLVATSAVRKFAAPSGTQIPTLH